MQHYENIFFAYQKWCEDFVSTWSVTFRSIVDLHGCISILLSSKLEANSFVTLIYADDHKIHLDVTCWHFNSHIGPKIRAKCSEQICIWQRLRLHRAAFIKNSKKILSRRQRNPAHNANNPGCSLKSHWTRWASGWVPSGGPGQAVPCHIWRKSRLYRGGSTSSRWGWGRGRGSARSDKKQQPDPHS